MKTKVFYIALSWVVLNVHSSFSRRRPSINLSSSLQTAAKLSIDKSFIAYVNQQSSLEQTTEVIIFADTIIIRETDTLRNINLQLFTNFFMIEPGNSMIISPSGLGQNGKSLVLNARKVEGASFRLLGSAGNAGATGKKGLDGDQKKVDQDDGRISLGARGEPGQKGEKGGDGGNLTINSLTNTPAVTFDAKGGQGGVGGEGGQGGGDFLSTYH